MQNGLNCQVTCHKTNGNEVNLSAIETGLFSRRISVNKKDPKGCLDWEVVDQLGGSPMQYVREGAPWACLTYLFDVGVHFRPVVPQVEMMEGRICIHVTTNGIGEECNGEDVAQFVRNDLEMHIKCAAPNWFRRISISSSITMCDCCK
jgi:hypothetical protein